MGKFGKILLGSAATIGTVLAAPVLLPAAGGGLITAGVTGAVVGAVGAKTGKAISKGRKNDEPENTSEIILSTDEVKVNFLKGIIRLAKSDGVVDPKELYYYEETAHAIGLSKTHIDLIDNLWESDTEINIEFENEVQKEFFFEYAIMLCFVDGEHSEAEKEEIHAMAEELNVDSEIIENITKRVFESREKKEDSSPSSEADIAAKQVKVFKQEYQHIVEALQDECNDNEKKKEIMDECSDSILPFISNIETANYNSEDVNACMTAMSAVMSVRFDEDDEECDASLDTDDMELLVDNTSDLLISTFKSYLGAKLNIAFFNADKVWSDSLIDKAKRIDWDTFDSSGFDEALESMYEDIDFDLGCSKSDARKLEELMGTEFPEFDVLLERQK